MKCPKCEKEIDNYSKFCSNCGAKVEKKSDIDIEGLAKICSQVWYILGFVRAKSSKKEIGEFEKSIKNCDECLYDWYLEVVEYWRNWAKQNNEEPKKTNRSKRDGISKTERNQVSQK